MTKTATFHILRAMQATVHTEAVEPLLRAVIYQEALRLKAVMRCVRPPLRRSQLLVAALQRVGLRVVELPGTPERCADLLIDDTLVLRLLEPGDVSQQQQDLLRQRLAALRKPHGLLLNFDEGLMLDGLMWTDEALTTEGCAHER